MIFSQDARQRMVQSAHAEAKMCEYAMRLLDAGFTEEGGMFVAPANADPALAEKIWKEAVS